MPAFKNMRKLIVANWKSNPATEKEAIELAKKTDFEGIVIAPPFVFIKAVKKTLTRANLGAQNVFWGGGAHTGEVSPAQLKGLGVSYVIIGHSEMRSIGETDEIINKKVLAALEAGLKTILCVGENASVRSSGIEAAKSFVKAQLVKDLVGIENFKLKIENLSVAYEPLWAIGTGNPDTPENAAEMSAFIKSLLTTNYRLQTAVLYGGSVTGKNAAAFLSQKEIDGALVGGASLKPDDFSKIVEAAK